MAKSRNDRESLGRSAASGIAMMVLSIISFLAALWIIMAIVRLLIG